MSAARTAVAEIIRMKSKYNVLTHLMYLRRLRSGKVLGPEIELAGFDFIRGNLVSNRTRLQP